MARVRVKSSSSLPPSPQRIARCKRGQILGEALQHLEDGLAVAEKHVAPHHRIRGGDAGEVAEAAGREFDDLGFERLLEVGRGADDGIGDEVRQMRGDGQHHVVMLRRPWSRPSCPALCHSCVSRVERRRIGAGQSASECTSGRRNISAKPAAGPECSVPATGWPGMKCTPAGTKGPRSRSAAPLTEPTSVRMAPGRSAGAMRRPISG